MVHPVEKEDVRVAGIAGQEERDDLTAPVRELPVPAGPAIQDDVDDARIVALVDDVGARADLAYRTERLDQPILIRIRQANQSLQLSHEWIGHGET